MPARVKGHFVEPMLLLRTDALPADRRWDYQLKLDGYRAVAFRTGGTVHLRSRKDNDFSVRYPAVVQGLAKLPNETVIDGEIVALDSDGRPSVTLLQNYGSEEIPIVYFVFDVMVLAGLNVMGEPLTVRRQLLETRVLPKLTEPVRYAVPLDASLAVLTQSVRAQGFEGLVAKRLDSRYQPGLRSGAWMKMRVNRGQEVEILLMRSSSVTTRVTGSCTRRGPAMDSHQWFVRSCSGSFGRRDQGVPVCELAGAQGRAVGCRLDREEDG